MYLAREESAANEKDVKQILCFVNVAKGLSRLCASLATFDVHKLVVRQVEVDDGHGLFDAPLVLFQDFGIRTRR